jgi:hypothetical protein
MSLYRNKSVIAQQGSRMTSPPMQVQGLDDFDAWMTSDAENDSLWRNRSWSQPIYNYLGRIYGHRAKVASLCSQVKAMGHELDELDVLYELIHKLKAVRGNSQSIPIVIDSCMQLTVTTHHLNGKMRTSNCNSGKIIHASIGD